MGDYKTIAVEDDSESWAAQIALEQRQQEEEREQPRMDTREILERLQKAGAILDVCDARLEHLNFMINETVERIEKSDLKFRESLKIKSRAIIKKLS
tara:strand:- start:14 stop:304 length:291 start_codon:yes stop_codon:yes gene_type:complete